MSAPGTLRLAGADIDLLPGSGDDLRAAASTIRSTVDALTLAVEAAERLGDLLAGDAWSGLAWTAFVGTVERHRLHGASTNAIDRMGEAATAVEALASAHDRHQDQLRWCRDEFAAVVDSALAGDEDAASRAHHLLDEAQRTHRAHEHSEMELRTAFDQLDDATMFATPPDSMGDRFRQSFDRRFDQLARDVRTVWDVHWEFHAGVLEGAESLGKTMALLSNPAGAAVVAWHLYSHREEYQAAFDYAVDNPGEFAREFGKAFVDWDTWAENPARAAGRLVPDLALTAMTWGAGGAAKGGLGAADAGVDASRAASRASRAVDNVADAAENAATSSRLIDDVADVNDALERPGQVVDVDEAVIDVGESHLEPDANDSRKEKVGG